VLLEPKSGGARPKKNLFPALCAGSVPLRFRSGLVHPHFQIRSGATGHSLELCADELVVGGGAGWAYDRRRRRAAHFSSAAAASAASDRMRGH